jgi:hypothetical protein
MIPDRERPGTVGGVGDLGVPNALGNPSVDARGMIVEHKLVGRHLNIGRELEGSTGDPLEGDAIVRVPEEESEAVDEVGAPDHVMNRNRANRSGCIPDIVCPCATKVGRCASDQPLVAVGAEELQSILADVGIRGFVLGREPDGLVRPERNLETPLGGRGGHGRVETGSDL